MAHLALVERDSAATVQTPAVPAWAKALIVAEREIDNSEPQSDYFATKTTHVIALAWSKHTKDLFAELRKAAASADITSHMGPGRDRFIVRVVLGQDVQSNGSYYSKGSPSHWHSELDDRGTVFTTRDEADAFIASQPALGAIYFGDVPVSFEWHVSRQSIEHREKYSMGHGYYLKAGNRYGSGWVVRKQSIPTNWSHVDAGRL